MKKIMVLLLAVCLAGLLAGCGSIYGEEISGKDQEAVLAFTEPKTDNLMTAMNANDYASFSKDFDQYMKNTMNQNFFDVFKQDRDLKLGKYVSRKVTKIILSGDYYTVLYEAVFEKDKDVAFRVVFHADDPHQISGLWFNE